MRTIPNKLGRYSIIREIGRGAMGVVYKAHDPIIEREVAIKAIHLAFQVTTEEKALYLNRFYREAKAAGKLNHPNIVTIYDVDEDKESGTPFIVMEFLEGTTLQEIMSSGILLPIDDISSIITQIADALNYAHVQGVVHRDVKSANILVLQGMKAKIMDFGIARLPSSDLTRSGQFMGTPNYMSPEQIEGKIQVDGRTDLFSLGVILYMLLTGERPFPGESFNTVSYKIVHVDPIPPRLINSAVPEGYNNIVAKILAKDPSVRYSTGAELISDIKRVGAGQSIDVAAANLAGEHTVVAGDGTASAHERVPFEAAVPKTQPAGAGKSASTKEKFRAVRWVPLAVVTVVITTLTMGGLYWFGFSQTEQPAPVSTSPVQLKDLSRENAIRIRWDLAVMHNQNGRYDQSISELNEILQLHPANQEARQYLELVKERKSLQEKQKELDQQAQTQKVAMEKAAEMQRASARQNASRPKPISAVPEASTLQPQPVATEPVKTTVHFELEHSFPSGVFYIYHQKKVIYSGVLSGTERKVLIFRNYKGNLNGYFSVPPGDATLTFYIMSKEQGISARKTTTVTASAERPNLVKIKYVKATKQLEVKWI